MATHAAHKPKKMKVGTILDTELYTRLKLRSAKEGRSISTIIEEAVLKYEQEAAFSSDMRTRALESVFAIKFRVSGDDLREIMEEDYFDQ